MQKVYYVQSDNFVGCIFEEAYVELRLQMSSGDFGAHEKTEVMTVGASNASEVIWDVVPSTGEIHQSHWTVSEWFSYVSDIENKMKQLKTTKRTICKARIYQFVTKQPKPIDPRQKLIAMQMERMGCSGRVISLDQYKTRRAG